MTGVALVVTTDELARRLGIQQPLDTDDRWALERAIGDAQADLEAYLGRAITPRTYTETGLVEHSDGWHLANFPVVSVTSVTAEVDAAAQPTGRFTVEYVAGLDGANDPALEPIRRYVRAHAMFAPETQVMLQRIDPGLTRVVQSASVEGQSVTYATAYAAGAGAPGSGAPGALPTLKSCERWRLAGREVFQRPTPYGAYEPWPYDWPIGVPSDYRPWWW